MTEKVTRKRLTVTSPAEFRKRRRQTELLDLGDGLVVRVRKLDLVDLAVSGYVPLTLVSTLTDTGAKLQNPEKIGEIPQEDLAKLHDVLRRVAIRAVVEPKLSETESEDAIPVDDLGILNLLAVFSACVDTKGASALRPFRRG